MNIEPASLLQVTEIKNLLSSQHLPAKDISPQLEHFFIVRENDSVIAVGGLELYDQYALLRSMATHPAHRKKGIAGNLVNHLLQYARGLNIHSVFLLTETAEQFFLGKGFQKIDRNAAPAAIQQSSEYCSVCPASAALMKLEIN